jgi:hypothetical protein
VRLTATGWGVALRGCRAVGRVGWGRRFMAGCRCYCAPAQHPTHHTRAHSLAHTHPAPILPKNRPCPTAHSLAHTHTHFLTHPAPFSLEPPLQALESLLALWHQQGGNKVLLFSNSVKMLRILAAMVTAKGYDHIMLDGTVAQQARGAG